MIGFVGIPYSDAFFEDGIVIEVPGQIMNMSQNVISSGETMFVDGSFKQPVDDFTANIFKDYEYSSKLVLTLSPSSNEFGDFNFNFTIPQDWELGNYHIVLENGLQFMDWEFDVRKNYSVVTLNRTVYPVPWDLSPLKQFKSGISLDDIQCKNNLVLIQKHDGSPVCVTSETKQKLIERGWTKLIEYKIRDNYEAIKKHPTVKAFYEKYSDAIEEIRDDHISYVTGSDEGFKVRMKLFFDENYELDHIDFHCYFQREHQNDVPESFILRYLKDFECEKRSTPAIVIIPYGSASPENQFHLIPEEITVVLGENNTVTWRNQDDVPSILTSDSSGWSTGVINPGESAYVMFNETGVYPYHGEPHPWKVGKVIVLAD